MPLVIHFVFAFLTGSAAVISASSPKRPTATIDSGVVVGTTTSTPSSPFIVEQFLGVPFAAAPVRFKPPKPPIPWTSPYDASTYKPSCFQQFDYPKENHRRMIEWVNTPGPPAGESEDCLNLNVFVPEGGTHGKAVMFWIHGGAFSFGSGSLPIYDGSSFAANHDVVVVTVNYRTNVFGFPGSVELPEMGRNLG
jgi:carboxylesterase type B